MWNISVTWAASHFLVTKIYLLAKVAWFQPKVLNLHQKLGYLRSHGMTTLTLDRHKGRAITYDVAQPGLNYRMDEMRAAIGSVQLDKLPAGNAGVESSTERYQSKFHGSVSLGSF